MVPNVNTITRHQLASMLEGETHNEAAADIIAGKDPVMVMQSVIEWRPLHNDHVSLAARATFQDIINGTTEVR